jgi:hypothetical protein
MLFRWTGEALRHRILIEPLRLHVEHARRGLDFRPMQAAFKTQCVEIEIQKVRLRLAAQGKRLPLPGSDDVTANRQYSTVAGPGAGQGVRAALRRALPLRRAG